MFKKISENKTKYKNGQVFPFLISLLCVLIIMIMITVNLGQIGVFKTDVSNAADSAALAGASVLSGTLLGLGLRSDVMAGKGIISFIAGVIALCTLNTPQRFITSIAIWVSHLVSGISEFLMAFSDAKMGWTNAKQAALQYAFQNVGIDEPRPSFKKFVKKAYPHLPDIKDLSPSELQTYYGEYLRGESANARKFGLSGFSYFIQDSRTGFWNEDTFGKIHPESMSLGVIQQGYGWEQDLTEPENFYSSYSNSVIGFTNLKPGVGTYTDYNNWVDVMVEGNVLYSLDLLALGDLLPDWVEIAISVLVGVLVGIYVAGEFAALPILNIIIGVILGIIAAALVYIAFEIMSIGLRLADRDGNDIEENETTGNPIKVIVRRYRQPQNLGLWNFRYGIVAAQSSGHAYRENESQTIQPTLIAKLEDLVSNLTKPDFDWGWFETGRHLFETRIVPESTGVRY
jgi:hypothetical protein